MKNFNSKFTAFMSVLALSAMVFMAIQAHAQNFSIYAANTVLSKQVVTNATTWTPVSRVSLDVSKQNSTGLQITQWAASATTTNLVYTFARSVDGQSYETTPSITLTYALNGTNILTYVTNLTSLGGGYLKLVSIQNTDASVVATNSMVYATKIQAP